MNDALAVLMVAATALVALAAFVLVVLVAIWKLASEIAAAADKIVYMLAVDSPASREEIYGNDADD